MEWGVFRVHFTGRGGRVDRITGSQMASADNGIGYRPHAGALALPVEIEHVATFPPVQSLSVHRGDTSLKGTSTGQPCRQP